VNASTLNGAVAGMLRDGRGLLAMDESTGTCDKRFAAAGIARTEELRRQYRELLVTTPGLGEFIGGAILYDETIRQRTDGGILFTDVLVAAGIVPGIKVDLGAKSLAGRGGERVTEGLDGLRGRLEDYRRRGARFAKWRAVFSLGPEMPSRACLEANANALARYGALCQEAGLVPIAEPELLMEGAHGLEACGEATEEILWTLFDQYYTQGVALEGMILKVNMVLRGLDCPRQPSAEEAADATAACLLRAVPAAVAGVVFLSGGQSGALASARLNALNVRSGARAPWPLSFSFARALQTPALEIWRGERANVAAAQSALLHRARCNRAARRGEYDAAQEER